MRYLSVCSGIEAATAAWHPLGWEAAAFSEIDPFACAVLRHHYPTVDNLGDLTRIGRDDGPRLPAVDLLVGGTPCQSFSVAGLRAGLADPRGNLVLEYLRVLDRARPRWCVWENVPGVLSIDQGRAFGAVLGGLAELGYGFAYRVLDAQYFGVPQRRRRVFVVGCLGSWQRAAAVLFERASLSGHPAPRREAGERVASLLASGAGTDRPAGIESETDFLILDEQNAAAVEMVGALSTGAAHTNRGFSVTHSLTARSGATEDGTGRDTPLVPVAFDSTWSGDDGVHADEVGSLRDGNGSVPAVAYQCRGTNVGEMGTLRSGNGNHGGGVPFAVMENVRAELRLSEQTDALTSGGGKPGQGYAATMTGSAVRRLTPVECERLQGFPDDYTAVPYRGKPASDGPRYRALGNSMAVPCMAWIGRRIQMVEEVSA